MERPDFEKMSTGIIIIRKDGQESNEEDYYAAGLHFCWDNCVTPLIAKEQLKDIDVTELEAKLPLSFWKRLYAFVENVEVNDLPGDEEKEMILSVAKRFIITPREQNGKG